MIPHLRIARPTDRLSDVVAFYRDALGLDVIGGFTDHDGFDGVMLGMPGASWHLEFTHARGEQVGRAPTLENLLVLYVPDDDAWRAAIARLEAHGHRAVAAHNPYWDLHGRSYEDPDGYRVVVQKASWPPARPAT